MLARVIVGVVAAYGVLVGLTVLVVVAYDLTALSQGLTTISAETLRLGQRYPLFPALVGCVLGFTLGVLFGHLFFPQYPVK